MNKINSYSVPFLVILTSFILTSCPGSVCLNPNPIYSFAITATIIPPTDSLRVGDSLYVISEFSTRLIPLDQLSNQHNEVDYSQSTGIGSTLGVLELDTTTASKNADNNFNYKDAVNSFDYVNIQGQIYNSRQIPSPDRVQQLRYEEKSNKYSLKVALIPKRKGIYSITVGSAISNGRRVGDKCARADFPLTLTNADTNFYYYQEWSGSAENSAPGQAYWFKVY